MCCVIKRHTWVLASCTILLLAFVLVGAGCGDSVSKCGNGIREITEFCDGTDLAGLTCADFGFTGGTLACNATCNNVDTTDCTGGQAGWTCPPWFYGAADGCDCGCGVIDLDCADGTASRTLPG